MAVISAALDSDIFQKNLDALRQAQPAAADLLAAAELPQDVRVVHARDGVCSFAWTDGERTRWLGRTTMRRVRAEALVEQFAPGSGNAAFVGIAHGLEVKLLLARLAPVQAAFVIDESAAGPAMAMRLIDFSVEIAGGRLVL